jgi:hypothetical protein
MGKLWLSRNWQRIDVAVAGGQFWNTEKKERPPLEVLTRELVATQQIEKTKYAL